MSTIQCSSLQHGCPYCGQWFPFKNSLTKHVYKGWCTLLKKLWLECSHLVPTEGQRSTVQEDSTLSEYVETMENTRSPVKKEELNAEDNSEEGLSNKYDETTKNMPSASHIKEEEQDMKYHIIISGG